PSPLSPPPWPIRLPVRFLPVRSSSYSQSTAWLCLPACPGHYFRQQQQVLCSECHHQRQTPSISTNQHHQHPAQHRTTAPGQHPKQTGTRPDWTGPHDDPTALRLYLNRFPPRPPPLPFPQVSQLPPSPLSLPEKKVRYTGPGNPPELRLRNCLLLKLLPCSLCLLCSASCLSPCSAYLTLLYHTPRHHTPFHRPPTEPSFPVADRPLETRSIDTLPPATHSAAFVRHNVRRRPHRAIPHLTIPDHLYLTPIIASS
ncbi:hypothetical protein CGCVW01_v010543, partial [Colletotrichum viniferum]